MKISTLIFRSMLKNSKHYFLYFFALIFSTTLLFSFLTIATNEDIVHLKETDMKTGAAFNVGAVILVIIVVLFVFYANQIFMKRRSKEIGLYQMIGMPKSTINWMIVIENIVLWVIAVSVGILFGFFFSRLFTMIFLKVVENDRMVALYFSSEALWKTIGIFVIILLFILLQSTWMVARSKLLDLFQANAKAEQRVKKQSIFKILLGIAGIALIIFGYYRSTVLFEVNENVTMTSLMISMGVILLSVILGTFFIFQFSVSFVLNIIRASKKGHLSISDVLAISPIMHRMRSNSISLTLITTLTALALAILSLSYIAYYGIQSSTNQSTPYDYTTFHDQGKFQQKLDDAAIDYEKYNFDILNINADINPLMAEPLDSSDMQNKTYDNQFLRVSDVKQLFPNINVAENEAYAIGYSNIIEKLLNLQKNHKFVVDMDGLKKEVTLIGMEKGNILPLSLTFGNPTFVISDEFFDELQQEPHIKEQTVWRSIQGFNIKEQQHKQSDILYSKTTDDGTFTSSNGETTITVMTKDATVNASTEQMGLVIFITGFIGLAFLLATGSILYFKQMSEAEDERHSFLMMRKIGFSVQEIMHGIYVKQLISFGLPLLLGILHSYFAVQCGWMFFGTEFYTPLFITMGIYILLYSIFALLTARYYKKIVINAL